MEKNRSKGVTIVSILLILYALPPFLGNVILLFHKEPFESLLNLKPLVGPMPNFSPLTLIAYILLICSAVGIYGLSNLARLSTMVIIVWFAVIRWVFYCAHCIFFYRQNALPHILKILSTSFITDIIICIFVICFLTHPKVKEQFS